MRLAILVDLLLCEHEKSHSRLASGRTAHDCAHDCFCPENLRLGFENWGNVRHPWWGQAEKVKCSLHPCADGSMEKEATHQCARNEHKHKGQNIKYNKKT